MNPYLRPLYDALYDMLDAERVERLLERGVIEVAPIAFMRGRTLNDAFVILDEAQNTTSEQMKMFLTRLGFGSKAVVTGDVTQIDLPPGRMSGSGRGAQGRRRASRASATIYFDDRDVVRHSLVQQIVKAYESYSSQQKTLRTRRGAWLRRRHPSLARRRHRRPRPAPGRRRPRAVARAGRAARARGAVGVALVSDAAMRRLNREYRGIDKTTDVLSFPAGPEPPGHARAAPSGISRSPGAWPPVRPGAQGHSFTQELRILALHGLLHLLGYDHETDRGEMRRAGRAPAPAGRPARRA